MVRGPNEAGKSTIQRALELVLSRKVTSTQGDLELMRPWTSAIDARPVISLEFTDDEFEVTHHGKLEKQFRGARGTVRLEVDGDVTTDPTRAEELIAEITGIPTEPFFRSTASVRHHELDELDRDESALRDRLQASISGGDRGTSAAKKKLEKALRDLNTRGDRNPGRLKVAEEAVVRAAALVDRGEAELAQLEKDRDALAAARETRRTAEATLGEGRSMLEKARQAERLISDREAATERHERYRQAVMTSEEIDQLQATHPSRHPLAVIKQIVERLRVLDRDIAELKASLGEAVDVEFELQVPEPTWIRWAALAMVLSVGAVAGAAIGIITGTLTTIPVALIVILMLTAGVAFSAYAVRQRRAAYDFRRSKQLRDDQIARRLRGRSQLESELRDKEADFAAQLQTLALPDLPSAEDLLTREEAHVQSIEKLQARLEGFVGKQPADSLPKLRDAAAMEVEQKTAALDALGPIAREPRARERLEVEVKDSEAALEVARDGEANCRARVEANAVDAELVAAEAERLAAWREQLAALQRRARVYAATLAAIETAERATMKTATRYLEKRMDLDIGRITAGRYRRVRVDDQTLDIDVYAPEKADWVPVSQLSQGTLDQVYLAARLGLVRLVTGDRRPPLIFDDPFITFDDSRALRALDLLRDLASDFQVIYLTCSDRYDSIADAVVELPAPTALDDEAENATGPVLPLSESEVAAAIQAEAIKAALAIDQAEPADAAAPKAPEPGTQAQLFDAAATSAEAPADASPPDGNGSAPQAGGAASVAADTAPGNEETATPGVN